MIKTTLKKARQWLRKAKLHSKGFLIPFLGVYWDEREMAAAAKNSLGDSGLIEAIEARFLTQLRAAESLAVATNSGRTALELGLCALKARHSERTEVLIPSYSCRGLLDPVVNAGLKPVFTDIGPDLNITAECVAPLLGEKTLALVVPHLGGRYATDLPLMARMTENVGATLIEDVCQAAGGEQDGATWGSEAPMAIYSFALGKNLTATAGGMLVSRVCRDILQSMRDELIPDSEAEARQRFEYLKKMYYLKNQAYLHAINSPEMPLEAFSRAYQIRAMSALDAALLHCQLDKMESILSKRRQHADIVRATLNKHNVLKVVGPNTPSVWTKLTVQAETAERARQIRGQLKKMGIETEVMYKPLHLRECGAAFTRESLPLCEILYPRIFNIPIRPNLRSEQLAYIVKTIEKLS